MFLTSLIFFKFLNSAAFRKPEVILISIFCLLFDISLILGYHIDINGSTYAGLAAENYISPYSYLDLIAFFFMLPCLLVLAMGGYSLITHAFKKPNSSTSINTICLDTIDIKSIVLLSLIPFICWIPYLLIYWPGFIFGDTLSSLAQATGMAPYSNHHPFVYTIFIKCCLKISSILGFGATGGCVLYCLIQMAFMAFTFSYLSQWITTRCSLKRYWNLIIILIFSLSPYIATYSIAMWKDPIFSTSLVLATLLLMDFILARGNCIKHNKLWIPLFVITLLITVFSRNNGIYIIAVIELVLVALLIVQYKYPKSAKHDPASSCNTSDQDAFNFAKVPLRNICISVACVIIASLVITGPIYKAIGVAPSEKAESVGILLNQMARVAALDGDMTENDKEYLNSIVPYEQYKTLYTPTCTDTLKWSPSFNNDALENNFFEHWLSLFIQNPRVYFEAWELQTFGFWAVNEPHIFTHGNISGGVPRNTVETYAGDLDIYQINAENKFGDNNLRNIFTQNNQSIPISFIFWGLLYLSICLIMQKRTLWLVALVPSLALLATLIVASPIWYWPRYGAAVQFLIPFYVALFVLLGKRISKA